MAEWIGNDVHNNAYQIPAVAGSFVGQTFTTTWAFDKVEVEVPTYTTVGSDFLLEIRTGSAFASTLVHSAVINDHPDNAWATMTLPTPAAAGSYQIRIYRVSGTIGVWHSTTNRYPNGSKTTGTSSSMTAQSTEDICFKVWQHVPTGPVAKRWTGSAWVDAVIKRWNGSSWVTTTATKY